MTKLCVKFVYEVMERWYVTKLYVKFMYVKFCM